MLPGPDFGNRAGNLTEGQLADMLLFANAAASIVTTRKGAIRSMPSREEAVALMAEGF